MAGRVPYRAKIVSPRSQDDKRSGLIRQSFPVISLLSSSHKTDILISVIGLIYYVYCKFLFCSGFIVYHHHALLGQLGQYPETGQP
jgi:hypothetical protein